MLARAKRSKLNIGAMDLLVYQNGGSSGIILPSSEGAARCFLQIAHPHHHHSVRSCLMSVPTWWLRNNGRKRRAVDTILL